MTLKIKCLPIVSDKRHVNGHSHTSRKGDKNCGMAAVCVNKEKLEGTASTNYSNEFFDEEVLILTDLQTFKRPGLPPTAIHETESRPHCQSYGTLDGEALC